MSSNILTIRLGQSKDDTEKMADDLIPFVTEDRPDMTTVTRSDVYRIALRIGLEELGRRLGVEK